MTNESIKTTRFIQGTAAASIAGFLIFNKLPFVGSIQVRPLRLLVRLGLLVAPTYIIANTMIPKLSMLKDLAY